MVREVDRTQSIKNYYSIKTKRRLEIFGFIFSALVILIGTLSYLIGQEMSSSKAKYRCSYKSTQHIENITDSQDVGNGNLRTEGGITYPPRSYWISKYGTTWGCPCLLKPCIYNCCKKGQTYIYVSDHYTNKVIDCANQRTSFNFNGFKAYKDSASGKDLTHLQETTIKKDQFYVINGSICNGERFIVNLGENNIFFLENGKIFKNDSSDKKVWDSSEFCFLQSFNKQYDIQAVFCYQNKSNVTGRIKIPHHTKWTFTVRGAGLLISLPFLLITLLVYILLPQLKNLHGKALMCYVASLSVAFLSLAIVQLASSSLHNLICTGLAFVIQFSVLTSIFWLNVMCFDIWWAFSDLKSQNNSGRDADKFKFILYSLYAWGCPTLILAVSLIVDFAPLIPSTAIKPGMGVRRCFFKEYKAKLLYLYLPIGVLVYLNIVMFLATSLRIMLHLRSVKALEGKRHINTEISTLNTRLMKMMEGGGLSRSDIQRFNLYLKLFLLMGVNWLFELLSFFVRGSVTVWLVTDVGNALVGVFIFYMTVCTPRILRLLSQRLGLFWEVNKTTQSLKTASSRFYY